MAKELALSSLIADTFRPVHRAIKEHAYTHYWLHGGRASTKSSFISLEIVLGIMRDPEANAVVLRKVAAGIRDSVYEQYMWAISALGVSDYWDGTKSPMALTYTPTGQSIKLRGGDEPRKLKSLKFARGRCKYIHYEELDEFTPEDIRSINQTLMRGGDGISVFYSYNPPASVQAWVNTEAKTERPDRLTHKSTYLDVPREWLGEQFLIEAEHLKRVHPEKYAHEYLAEIIGTGGEIFRNVVVERITDEQIEMFDNIRRAVDFGFASDPLAYNEIYYDKTRRRIYIFREVHGVEMKNRVAVELIMRGLTRSSATIVADSAEPRTIAEFRDLGLTGIVGARKGADSIDNGIKYLRDMEAIIIDPERCPHTFKEFSEYEREKDKNGGFKNSYPGHNDHHISACRYALEDDMRGAFARFY